MILMTYINQAVKYRSVIPLDSQNKEDLYCVFNIVSQIYNKYCLTNCIIHCNIKCKVIMDPVEYEISIEMNYSAADIHVPDIIRNNRVMKEIFPIAYYWLPFKKIPKIMIWFFATVCAKQLNLFPANNGILLHYSTHMIMTGCNFDYENHCVCKCGMYL